MSKVRLNEDCEIVARVKEGLKRKEGFTVRAMTGNQTGV